MIISRAPLRISLAGGGSDLPAYFLNSQKPGLVVSMAIQKYVYIILNKKFDDGVCIKYSKTEHARDTSKIHHDVIRETLKHFGISRGIEIATIADVPGYGTGLGSSSALAVALIMALAKYTNTYFTPYECAKLACEIEINKCGHPIGYQDQFASAFGGLNTIEFRKREVRVDPIKPMYGYGFLEEELIAFWVGIRKTLSEEILREQKNELSSACKMEATERMTEIAKKISTSLWENSVTHLGQFISEAWKIKQSLSAKITNEKIDKIIYKGIAAGATGAKVLGAGGGGFVLFCAHRDRHISLKHVLSLKCIGAKIDTEGVKIVEQR